MRIDQILGGLRWTTLATGVNVLAQLGFMAVLARLLEPAAFGLMVMAHVVLRFASFFAQMGTTQTLIQRPTIDRAFTSAALAVSAGVSLLLYAAIAAAAPLFAGYFRSAELVPLLWMFGLSLPLSGLAGPPVALLRRQGRFRAVSLAEVGSYVLGYGVTGIACALAGLGVWSLVYATLAQQALMLLLAFGLARYPLAWPLQRDALRAVLGAGSQYSLIGFLEFLWANVESLLVGRLAGAAALGVMNRAQMLANLPVEQAMGAVFKVLFPALSSMQADRARMADGVLVMLLATGAISVVLSAALAGAAPDVVALLLGPRWGEAVPLLATLALGVPAMFLYAACGTTLDSLAALRAKLLLQSGLLPVKLVLVLLAWRWQLQGVAWAMVIAEYLRLVLGLGLLARLLPLSRAALARLLAGLLLAGLAVFAAVWSAAHATAAAGWPLAARLAAEAAAAAAVAMAAALLALHQGAGYGPLQRFEALRRWHQQALRLARMEPRS
jgi:lipopolysaccharide exporter